MTDIEHLQSLIVEQIHLLEEIKTGRRNRAASLVDQWNEDPKSIIPELIYFLQVVHNESAQFYVDHYEYAQVESENNYLSSCNEDYTKRIDDLEDDLSDEETKNYQLEEKLETLEEENRLLGLETANLRQALMITKFTILDSPEAVIADTVWLPESVSPNETLIDFIEGELDRQYE